jgi:hypothetical protein
MLHGGDDDVAAIGSCDLLCTEDKSGDKAVGEGERRRERGIV